MIVNNDDNNDNDNDNDYMMFEYRGRLAPTPSGYLHKGHANTFCIAYSRSINYHDHDIDNRKRHRNERSIGKLILRIEDLDFQRCKSHYLNDMLEDLEWIGIKWNEGYNCDNNCNEQLKFMKSCKYSNNSNNLIYDLLQHINKITDGDLKSEYINALQSYKQSERLILYKFAWYYLFNKGYIYPSQHSRKDVETALSAPHDDYNKTRSLNIEAADNEVIFPKSLRPEYVKNISIPENNAHFPDDIKLLLEPSKMNWRFRVPDMKKINFHDKRCGNQEFTTEVDIGDFLCWRLDGYPSYELAVVVDDILMNITEIVRGEDLLLSTSRQIL